MYQTIFLISFKTAQFCMTLYFTVTKDDVLKDLVERFSQMCKFDILLTPLNIQISYFLCNKKTLAIVWKKLSNIYQKTFKKSTVESSVHQVTVPPK
ncbi:unnamed protein product [Caenorhabditis nigoni]